MKIFTLIMEVIYTSITYVYIKLASLQKMDKNMATAIILICATVGLILLIFTKRNYYTSDSFNRFLDGLVTMV